MYRMLYNDSFLFDPFDETRIVSSASITTNVNAASYLDFTIAANHPLYNEIEQRSGTITLYSDNEKLFQGQITAIDMDMDGNKSVTCSSALDWLKDVQLRPYSTDQAECDEYEFKLDKAPDALDAYFQWLIDQYNAQNKDGRYFTINVNQAADLTNRNIVYFASTSPRSVADAIEQDILGTFGGYLVLRYDDDQLILDLYSDIHEMNEQVIDYGENILDISRNESTDDQYTAVYPIGKTPQYTAEQQKYHDEKAIYDEYMKQREATEKAAIAQLQKEEEAEQKRINGMPNGQAKKNAENALKKRKDQRQAREKAFSDETKLLQDAQKIKDDKNAADKTKPNPITIESLDNGGYPGDLDIFKEGDVVYSVSYVQRYGYKEFVYNDTDIEDKQLLLALAVAKLKSLMAPSLTIDVRAVDQALYNPKHTHLFAGQAVRVRSKPHGVDEFMMVSSIDLDLIDPSRTTATLGVAYDTLTGQQSSFLRNLNSKIVASVDAVDKLGEDVKVTEITLGRVETAVDKVAADNELIVNTVSDYKWMTDAAWGKAEDAQESADEANRGVTDTNVRIDNIKMETDERIDGMGTDISGIHDSIDDTKAEVERAKQTAEQIRQEAQTGIKEAKDKTFEVEQNLDGFKQTVSETYTTKDEFNNLTIGGRNLLKDTKTTKQVTGTNTTNQSRDIYELAPYSWAHLEAGQYMLSVDMKYEGTISGTIGLMRNAAPWGFSPNASIKCTEHFTDDKRTAHFEFPIKNAYDGASRKLAVRFDNVQGTVTFSNVKLERGTKATAWSPAPEDMLDVATASTTYTTKSEFTQTAKEIKGTVAEHATTINGHTDSITTLSVKANKFETDIKQVTEQATAIADRTTTLEQDLGGFKQTVSGTYITKTDADKNLVDAINGMQIGGTNMLLDTRAFGSANPNNITAHGFSLNYAARNGTYNQFTYRGIPDTVTTNNPDGPSYNNIPIERGKTYTASFYYRGTADLSVYFYGPNGYVGSVATTASNGTTNNSVNGNDGNVTFAKDSEWKRYWVTWTLHKTGGSHLNKHLLFRRKGTTGYIDIAGVKLEEGTKATEWSPSPFDTLYASNIEKNYASKSLVEQTESRITSTVEQTYATKTQLTDEMKKSVKTIEIRGRQDGNYWIKLGRLTMAQLGKDFHIDYTGGRGFNGMKEQNAQLEIHVRSGNGNGFFFGVTLTRLLNADSYHVKAFIIDSTHIDLYMTGGGQFSTGTMAYYGQYTDFSGAKQIEDISTAEGTEREVLEESLSTKSYVNQTAESVSIGVVEDFKDGKHGDKLTTQSNLTALKDEINASVSEKYADLSDQIKLANSDNAIGKNFSFESNNFEGWASHDNWTIGWNGAHTGRYYAQNTIPANSNGNQLISMGSIAAEYGHTYKLEYWAKKKPNTQCRGVHRISYKRSGVWEDVPSDVGTTIFLDDEGKTNINVGANGGYFDVTDSWMKVTTYIIPPSNVTDIRVRIIGNNPGSAETVFAVDDVSLTDYSVAKTINKTMAGINVKADSITQEVRNDYATKDLVNRSIPGLKNPNFDAQKDGDTTITGWSVLGPWAETRLGNSAPVSSSEGGTYFIGRSGTTAGQTLELINQGYISAYPGMKVQISWWMFVDANIIQNSNFSAGIIANNVVTRNLLNNYSTGGWKYMTTTVTVPANVNQFRVRFGFVTTGTSGWLRLDSVSVTDVTEAKAAMGKATTVEANLEHYKTTVSNTYADKNTVTQMQTQWTQTAQGFEAAITANSHSVSVINSGFESGDLSGWEPWGFIPAEVTNTSLNGNSTYYFKGVTDSSNYHGLKNTGTIVARKNDQIKVSTRILVLDSSGNPVTATVSIGYQASYNQVPYTADTTTNTGWSVVSSTMNVPNDTLCSPWINIKNLRNGYTVCIDDVEMLNVTEAVILRNDLETRIAMTSRGVRVGKVENGTFKGMSALVNSEGSFDILNGEQVQATMSDSNVGLMRDNTTGRYRFQIKPYSLDGKNGTNLLSYGQVSLNSMPTVPATTSVNCMLPSGTATVNSGSSYIMPWNYSYFETNDLFIPYPQEYRTNYYQTISDGAILDDKAYKHAVGILGYDEEDRQSLVFLNPGMYAVQYNAHVLHTSKAYFDYCLRFKAPGSTSWVSIPGAPDWRAIEVDDPSGYLQRTSIVAWVNVDVGTMMQLHVKSSVNGQKLSVANHIHITRMPFGCAIMNQ